MKKDIWKIRRKTVVFAAAASMVLSPMQNVLAEEPASNTIFINEVESNDVAGGNDWIEIINVGESEIDISGWFVSDDKGLENLETGKTKRIADNTILGAGEVLVLEESSDFDFGLGKADTANLYNKDNQQMDTYTWGAHAKGTYSRIPDGVGEFTDKEPTKGTLNANEEELPDESGSAKGKLVINEVNSAPDDWVEIMNIGTEDMDISDFEIRDNSDDHRFKLPEGTIVKAGELFLVKDNTVGQVYEKSGEYVSGAFQEAIGIGSGDSIRIFDNNGVLLDEYGWTEHAGYGGDESAASYGRYPDGTGNFTLMPETPGEKNAWYKTDVVLNEIESNGDDTDWVEIYNNGTTAVDLTGWYILDNDPVGHASDVIPVKEGTILEPGAFYVFDENQHFTFGLGKEDQVTVFNKDGVSIDTYSWSGHADGVLARIPDGTGEFVDFTTSTKGAANVIVNPVVLNEVQSNDPDKKADWIELANPTAEKLDISGIVVKDSDDTHEYVIPEGTVIEPNGYIVLTEDEFGFGLGKNDSVRLFENGLQIAETTWSGHTNPTWGLYPDVNGNEYRNTLEATPGAANKFAGIPEVIEWQGDGEVHIFDTTSTFLEDSSGLDFYNGQLYAVDNGTGKFWIMDVAADGTLSFAKGFENGKRVQFQKDAGNLKAAGPDTEGITVDGSGMVYLASERDNSQKGVNFNEILMVNPNREGTDLVADQEWNLTESLPQVSANMGIEAVEWVAAADVNGKLYDQNTKAAFDLNNYPNAVANGVFFVALEDNGHAYAYVLNQDGTSVQIADIDSKIGGAMALDYDTYNHILWVVADNGYGNIAANITLNGSENPGIVHVKPAIGVDVSLNNEGFAIAEAEYTVNGQRPVYRFQDGVKVGALSIGSLDCTYETGNNGSGGSGNGGSGNNGSGNSGSGNNGSVNSGSGNNGNVNAGQPQTGDSANIMLFVVLILLSGLAAARVGMRNNK